MNDLIRAVATSQSVPVIELNQYLAPADAYTDDVAGITVRDEDHAHFSPVGEEYIGRWLIQQLALLR
jgi:lysophospholipase L1-like esterase